MWDDFKDLVFVVGTVYIFIRGVFVIMSELYDMVI